ncbi:MAG: N-acetylmuramoyl-L-alanine amidase [Deltaproteobacteria bacterium]
MSLIVLHYTSVNCAEALNLLCDPEKEVSAHYLIAQTGELISMVAEDQRAWHAGKGSWGAVTDVNSASIGIEIENDGKAPFTAAAMLRLEGLLADLLARYDLPPKAVIAHSDLAPTRKSDPGVHFDWQRLARLGLSIWPQMKPGEVDEIPFLRAAAQFGYGQEAGLETVLAAFRLRFRPGHHADLDQIDVKMINELARLWPAITPN